MLKKKNILMAAALFLTSLIAESAIASDGLELAPSFTLAESGTEFVIDVAADFDSNVIGGEVRVEYDPKVLFLSRIEWDAGYEDDPELRCPTGMLLAGARGCAGDRAFMAVGEIDGLPSGRVAGLVFSALGTGVSEVSLSAVSPFSDPVGEIVPVSLGVADVSVVPEPGFALALALGTGVLGSVSRTRRQA